MRKNMKYLVILVSLAMGIGFFTSCEEILDPEQELNITEERLFDDWYEYRSIEMGLYGLQQELVEQLVILGELRGDLLTITGNADPDMVEIYNFNISRTNKYASPTNFFKLISASNNFIRVLKREHPEIQDPESSITNYHRLYGEALCMRAWAYFNAVRIYGKVPFIHESLVTMDEIEDYVNSPGTYIDSVYINYSKDGYYNDTVYNKPVELERKLYDTEMIIDYFTNQLENEVRAVGVNHSINNGDDSWEVTIWNDYAMHALLGQMYLTSGDLAKAARHFEEIIYNTSENRRYHLDYSFAYNSWRMIFDNIDNREHIFTLWFNKANFQQNDLQKIFSPFGPHNYMLKPSNVSIFKWETVWRAQQYDYDNNNPAETEMERPGIPSDFYRGYGTSYLYITSTGYINSQQYMDMVMLRARGDDRSSKAIVEGADTVVFKYSVNKGIYDQDANFIVYRAASIHLYLSEIYTYWAFEQENGVFPFTNNALFIMNDGRNYSISNSRPQMGVRGRVGLGSGEDKVEVSNIHYIHDPFTNEILGYENWTGNLPRKQKYIEEQVMDERARELAFEGERFYDLMRVAKRRNDPSFLAEAVSSKYPAGMQDYIYNLLLDERNWYINYFE